MLNNNYVDWYITSLVLFRLSRINKHITHNYIHFINMMESAEIDLLFPLNEEIIVNFDVHSSYPNLYLSNLKI